MSGFQGLELYRTSQRSAKSYHDMQVHAASWHSVLELYKTLKKQVLNHLGSTTALPQAVACQQENKKQVIRATSHVHAAICRPLGLSSASPISGMLLARCTAGVPTPEIDRS